MNKRNWHRFLLLALLVGVSAGCRRAAEPGPNDAGYFALQSWKQDYDLRAFAWLRDNATHPGKSDAAYVRELLGEPATIVDLPDGGQAWTYVAVDTENNQSSTFRAVFDSSRVLLRWEDIQTAGQSALIVEGERVISIPGQRLHPDVLTGPNDEDVVYAKSLDKEIVQKGTVYAQKILPDDEVTLYAARRIGDFILICLIPKITADGAIFLVYSVAEERVIGQFSWEYQG